MILEQMSLELRLPEPYIFNLARGASREYKSYPIPKHNGSFRLIHHPSRRLKALQRWLLANVIEKLPIHSVAMAYRKGFSILENASLHARSNYLLRLDFVNFFESITEEDLLRYVEDRHQYFDGWTPIDVEVFCRIVCRNGALTIGAPTSPSLSNIICFDLDHMIQSYCQRQDITYSRYSDDLFFSTRHRGILNNLEVEVPKICTDLRFPGRLELNKVKVRHSSKRGARRVTGIVLGSDEKIYMGRSLKRKIRAQIHRLERLNESQRASLAGLLAYMIGNDPDFMNSLINKYGLDRVRLAQRIPQRV